MNIALAFETITNSLSDGLVVRHSDPLNGVTVTHSQFINNFGSGISTHTPWFNIINCQVTGSQTDAGIHFNPSMKTKDRILFHGGIVPTLTLFRNFQDDINTSFNHRLTTVKSLPQGWNIVETYEKLHPTGITFVNVPVGKSIEKVSCSSFFYFFMRHVLSNRFNLFYLIFF
ncbi:unnamed protein product [Trichobilharzia regenti]|nr:unnamed protein product [Trichobilharzia regenti]